jgi:hypothetical protein
MIIKILMLNAYLNLNTYFDIDISIEIDANKVSIISFIMKIFFFFFIQDNKI